MATVLMNRKDQKRETAVPKALRTRVEALLNENYAFMDSPVFRRKNIESELFTFEQEHEPALPMTSLVSADARRGVERQRNRCASADERRRGTSDVPAL